MFRRVVGEPVSTENVRLHSLSGNESTKGSRRLKKFSNDNHKMICRGRIPDALWSPDSRIVFD